MAVSRLKRWLVLIGCATFSGMCWVNMMLDQMDDESIASLGYIKTTGDPWRFCLATSSFGIDPHPIQKIKYTKKVMHWPLENQTIPERLGKVWNSSTRMAFQDVLPLLPPANFNPSIELLPRGIAETLHPRAHYVGISRHRRNLCHGMARAKIDHKGPDYDTVLVLDKNLETLLMGPLFADSVDLRLTVIDERLFVHGWRELQGGKYHYSTYVDWVLYELHLQRATSLFASGPACRGLLRAEVRPEISINGSNPQKILMLEGKNFGMMWRRRERDVLLFVKLTDPVDMRSWRNGFAAKKEESKTDFKQLSGVLSANGNAVAVPEFKAYLSFGHWHTPKAWGTPGQYFHQLILFSDHPPYQWLKVSPQFCFPAALDARGVCERVQFVQSLIREGDDLIISYGINDCEGAILRISLKLVLDHLKPVKQ
mmetsp:Transcript_62204/g.148402  ORF Transcript_62204/g.148402 Transcript_62204/m.148402 type:complete len:426 (-) Transcript_62204:38-1315(-)